jgi:hypothetical protein
MSSIALPDGVEIVPRLWIGSNASCDRARRSLNFTCINVGAHSHSTDPRCNFIPVATASNGLVSAEQLVAVERVIIGAWPQYSDVLVHCATALTYSPLTMALWLTWRYQINLTEAYKWVWDKQPQAKDLSKLAPPRQARTGP